MANTIGYHYVRSGYGRWLPGDDRGHWSEAWDQQIGLVEPRTLHVGDPVRRRMTHPPVRWSADVQRVITACIQRCAEASPWDVAGYAIEPTHLHLLLTYTTQDIYGTAKWLGQQMTKAVHRETDHVGPVFCDGRWLRFVYDADHWDRLIGYVQRHNLRRGL